MDHPFFVGFVILGLVWLIGSSVERFRDWAKVVAVLATLALIVDVLQRALR